MSKRTQVFGLLLVTIAAVLAAIVRLALDPGGVGDPLGTRPSGDDSGAPLTRISGADGADAAHAREKLAAGVTAEPTREVLPSALTGDVVVQADDVDRIVDVVGTELQLIPPSGAEPYRATVQPGGGVIFHDVEVAREARMFRLEVAMPGRICFPRDLPLSVADFSGDPPVYGVSVAFVHTHELIGVVRSASTRQPIAGAEVVMDSFASPTVYSDATGRYRIELPELLGTLVVRAPGYQEMQWHFPDTLADGPESVPDQRDFALLDDRLTAWIDVVARLPDGHAAASAELRVTPLRSDGVSDAVLAGLHVAERVEFLARLEEEIDLIGPVLGADGDVPPERLDAQGWARLSVILPGRYRISGRLGVTVGELEVDLAPGQRREVTLEMAPGAVLIARLRRDDERRSDRGVGVGVDVRLDYGDAGRFAVARSDAVTGDVELDGLPFGARGVLWAESALHSFEPVDVVLPGEGEPPLEVEVRVWDSGRALRGRVVDAVTGQPVAGARIRSRGPPPLSVGGATDAKGRFELEVARHETLDVAKAGFRSGVLRADGGSDAPITLALEPLAGQGASFEIRAIDAVGEPLAGLEVAIDVTIESADGRSVGDRPMDARTNEEGRTGVASFALVVGEILRVTAKAWPDGRAPTVGVFELRGGHERFELPIADAYPIRGRAYLPGDVPAANARVRLLHLGSAVSGIDELATTTTDAEGRFTMIGAGGPGAALWLEVSSPLRGGLLRLEPGASTELSVPLRPLLRVPIRVVGSVSGRPLGARDRVAAEAPFTAGAVTLDAVPVPEGQTSVLFVTAPGFAPLRVSLTGDTRRLTRIELPRLRG